MPGHQEWSNRPDLLCQGAQLALKIGGRPPPSATTFLQEQERPEAGAYRSKSFQEPESPDETKRLSLSQHEDAKVLPQEPSSFLDTTDARLDVSLMLALGGPDTDVEPKALSESPITPLSQPKDAKVLMLSLDGPNTDVEPKALGESPTTSLSQPKGTQL